MKKKRSQKPQKIVTRHIKIPRSLRPFTADDMKRQAKQQLQRGEQLIRLAFVAVEQDHIVIEIGIKQKQAQ